MKHMHTFASFINESKMVITDYSDSKNKIIVGLKTNLLKDMMDRYAYREDGDSIHFFNNKDKHFATLFDRGTQYQVLHHDGSINDYGWLKEGSIVKDKSVDHIENIEIGDDSDLEAEEEIQDYIEDRDEHCPRCGEHQEDCSCGTVDPWSTQNYHRVPKGVIKKEKAKQNFKTQ